MVLYTLWPPIFPPRGLTRKTLPEYPASRMFRMTVLPGLPGVEEAPITQTLFGLKNLSKSVDMLLCTVLFTLFRQQN